MNLSFSIFHEPWWLSAVTGGHYDEVTVKQRSQLVGRLPFIAKRRGPFRILMLPAFTHVLGPAIDIGVGKPQTQLVRRLSIARDLIDQLPSFDYMKQVIDPLAADGLAIADGLAFQDRDFLVSPQYTFHIDCRNKLQSSWDSMNTTVRQHIRRAEGRYSVVDVDDPARFVHFYLENIRKSNKANRTDFSRFANLFAESRGRKCGQILGAMAADNTPAAMTFLVWGHGYMYYLLSTRDPTISDNSSVSLLLWSAIKRAHDFGFTFDLDGVYSSGSAKFLSGFGGQIRHRLIVRRAKPIYRALQLVKMTLTGDRTHNFT